MRIERININSLTSAQYAEVKSYFSDFEQRITSGIRTDDIKRSLASRFLLKKLIKEEYGKKSFELKYSANGKPELDFCFLSLSHSGNYAVCAVSDYPIGVDIQALKAIKRRGKYMLFTVDESRFVNLRDSEERFYTLWTMKEAYVKANGGVLADAAQISLVTNSLILKSTFKDFKFKTFKYEGYILSVCEKLPHKVG